MANQEPKTYTWALKQPQLAFLLLPGALSSFSVPYIGIPVMIFTVIAHFFRQSIFFHVQISEDSLQYWTSSNRINRRATIASAFSAHHKLVSRIGQVYAIEFSKLTEVSMNLAGDRLIFSDDSHKKCFIDFTTMESKELIQPIYEIVKVKWELARNRGASTYTDPLQ